jgi:hypothetical protein
VLSSSLLAVLLAARAGAQERTPLPESALAVRSGGIWQTWWRSSESRSRWTAPDSVLATAIRWQSATPGVEWAQAELAGSGEAHRIRIVMVRLDPRLVRFELDTAFSADGERAAWSIDRAGNDALVAFNAGQFLRARPWGWVVVNGREWLAPGQGPLSTAVVFDAAGAVHWVPADSIESVRKRLSVRIAFQSYPVLLRGGEVPPALRAPGGGVDVAHRDARLALGETGDGKVLLVMTRFDALGSGLGFVPFGLTTPEMAALMGGLGAREALMLDGGISSQLVLRDRGEVHRWRGLRKVPLALVARRRRRE